ncbi:hypothetical protein H310_02658 [Aphanomyces invadans]|uniref:Uncharacterized protein n=1 Tax=Aphanomyces invadans TaxID=157072 RepID=A0A024UJP3_9STRA|nr:hypothetical protein H310_02658 [Aphanomyces invadans]ETW06385.1 hypothetical protein H310_02658 [Aphanomyces invadans]|eukprot:XP_008864460.1 hypothetical protein H310_02658 [Aphanomyces invadans]
MYDVDMDSYDADDNLSGRDMELKRTLSEHEAVVEHQLKRLKINHNHARNSSSPMPVGSDEPGRADQGFQHHCRAALNGAVTKSARECDVDYAYVNQLLREMHYLRELRKQRQAASSPSSSRSHLLHL